MWQVIAISATVLGAACFAAMVYVAVLYDRARRGIIDRYRRGGGIAL